MHYSLFQSSIIPLQSNMEQDFTSSKSPSYFQSFKFLIHSSATNNLNSGSITSRKYDSPIQANDNCTLLRSNYSQRCSPKSLLSDKKHLNSFFLERKKGKQRENHRPSIMYNTQKTICKQKDMNSPKMHETSATMKDINFNRTGQRTKSYYIPSKSYFQKETNHGRNISQKCFSGDNFDILKLLGKGKYGKVFLVKERDSGFILALKVIQKKQIIECELLEQFIRELKIQFYLSHPGIIQLYGFFDDPINFYLLMELGCGGELFQYTKIHQKFSEESSSYVARNLLQVSQHLHSKKIIHRDLKPQNIVVILGTMKICDFGWAVYNNMEMRSTFCGTPLYFSPQLLLGQEYDEKVDLWAIGVITYELVLGKSPFNLEKPTDLSKIVTQEIDFPPKSDLSAEFKSFLKRILEKNPWKRQTAERLLSEKFIRMYAQNEICEQLCFPTKSQK